MPRKLGVVLIGLSGSLGNAIALGSHIAGRGLRANRGLLTSHRVFEPFDLAPVGDMAFAGWDLDPSSGYEAGRKHGVLRKKDVEATREHGETLRPWPAVVGAYDVEPRPFDTNISPTKHPKAQYEQVSAQIAGFRKQNGLDHIVMGFVCSPLTPVKFTEVHTQEAALRRGLEAGDPGFTSCMVYALAGIDNGCSVFDFTANQTLEMPAVVEAAQGRRVPFAGADGRSGQTILKSALAELLRKRDIRVVGWYSANILGNNDGRVLAQPDRNELKMKGKKQVLAPVLGYDDFHHAVNITYYPPRGDNKEFWDNVDILGWLDMPMTFKINWMGRDSILAGPIILDIIRLLELAQRKGQAGLQGELDIFFKHPLGPGPHDGWGAEYDRFLRHYENY